MDILQQDVEVIANSSTDITANTDIDISSIDTRELDISFDNNEYSIVGDDMVVVTKYSEAPQWLKDTIDNIVNIKTAVAVGDLNTVKEALDVMLGELEVAKNTYQLSIISSDDIDQRILTAITTLNSSLQDADATILQIAQTAVTPAEASAIALNTLSASLGSNGEIGSAIHNLQTAMTTLQNTTATDISYLESTMQGEVEGNAQAMHVMRTYVGIDDNGVANNTGLLSDVKILQKQSDGIIETTTGTYDVMLNPQNPDLAELVVTAEPYASWKAADVTGMDTRLAHIGDVYIKYSTTSNGAKEYLGSYKFIKTIVDYSDAHHSTDADGFTWALIVDQAAQDAYTQALNAYDLADNKRRVFTTTPSGPYDVGDLWTKTVSGGSTLYKATVERVSGYVAGDWVVADDAGLNTFVNNTYTPTVTSLQNQVDGKVESWYTLSTNDPKTAWTDAATRTKHDGDLWYQTDTKLSYWYSSSINAWNLIDDAKAIQALANAAIAQTTADGKINSYYKATFTEVQTMSNGWTATEKSNNLGDLAVVWNDATLDNNGTWRWNGTSWVNARDKKLVSLASDVTTLRADLNTGTDTWMAGDTSVTNTVKAYTDGKVSGVESKWAYNSSLTIGGITYNSGFGLATSLTSGSGLPTGQSEFWIKADKFRLMSADGSRKSAYSPFTVDATTGNITFNGKVSFSNVTDTTVLTNSITTAQNTANTANSNALARTLPSEVAAAVNNNVTTINGSKITTGSITAAQIQAYTISADRLASANGTSTMWTGGGLISPTFNGNVVGNIGNPTQGFRLSSNAAGTLGSNDPNIYGAYIKGSIIDASSSFITSSTLKAANTGPAIASVVNPVLYGQLYGNGYIQTRFTKSTSYAMVTAIGNQYIQEDHPSTSYLQYRVNGGTWNNLDSVYNSSSGGKVNTRIMLFGVISEFMMGTMDYMEFRTTYSVNGSTSFTDTTIMCTIYNV